MVVTGSAAGVGYRRGVLEACRAPELEVAMTIDIVKTSNDFLMFISKV